MNLTLHIFRKDARRLWKEIVGTLALLAWLTQMDSWRGGYLPGSSEGWLNLLLPLAWGCLAALSVMQDPVPGERQFWLTLPCPPGRILAAKSLFVAAFIHLPYLISNIVVMSARGFAPWAFVPRLLQQQLLVLLAVTLPCIALAAVLRNAMQFVVALIAILGITVIFVGSDGTGMSFFQPAPWGPSGYVRQWICLALLGCVAGFVAIIQYHSRRSRISRLAGVSGLLAAAALNAWWPPAYSAGIELALLPRALHGAPAVVTVAPRENIGREPLRNGISVAIPIAISGAPPAQEARYRQLWFQLIEPNGTRHTAALNSAQARGTALFASVSDGNRENLTLDRALFNRLRNVPVTLRGYLTIQRLADPGALTIPENSTIEIPGLGRCFRAGTDGSLFMPTGLRVACESPAGIGETKVVVRDEHSGRAWEHRLGEAAFFVSYPVLTWLSPVDRRETYYPFGSAEQFSAGVTWIIPQDAIGHLRAEVGPRPVVSQANTEFELTGVRLGEYVVKTPQ
jgi:hypothetical protein